MRIYPDEELPNLSVEWEISRCAEAMGDVRIQLLRWDTSELVAETSAPCESQEVSFEDIAREHYRYDGYLLDASGEIYSAQKGNEVDMRDGLSSRGYVYFNGFANLVIGWSFDEGESCASLGIDAVEVEVMPAGSTDFFPTGFAVCGGSPSWTSVPAGTARFRVRGIGYDTGTIASSEVTPELVITDSERTDAGTLRLRRCDGPCP